MNFTVEDGRELLRKRNAKVLVIISYDPDADTLQFVTAGEDAEKADMAVRLSKRVRAALCVEEKGELLEDRRHEHMKPGEED